MESDPCRTRFRAASHIGAPSPNGTVRLAVSTYRQRNPTNTSAACRVRGRPGPDGDDRTRGMLTQRAARAAGAAPGSRAPALDDDAGDAERGAQRRRNAAQKSYPERRTRTG